MPLLAAHVRCRTCHYRLRRENVCELGVVDKPSLCPRMRPRVRVVALRLQCGAVAASRPDLTKGLSG